MAFDKKRKIETVLEENEQEDYRLPKHITANDDDQVVIFYGSQLHTHLFFDFETFVKSPEEAAREVVKCLGKKNIETIHHVTSMIKEDHEVSQDTTNIVLMVKFMNANAQQQAMTRGVRANKHYHYGEEHRKIFGQPLSIQPYLPQVIHGVLLTMDRIKRKKIV